MEKFTIEELSGNIVESCYSLHCNTYAMHLKFTINKIVVAIKLL